MYLVTKEYNGIVAGSVDKNDKVKLKVGERYPLIGRFIATPKGKAICYPSSELAFNHFVRDDDDMGSEKAKYIEAIVRSERHPDDTDSDYTFRFNEAEQEELRTKYGKYLKPLDDAIVFNTAFYEADISVLKDIAEHFHIEIPFEH